MSRFSTGKRTHTALLSLTGLIDPKFDRSTRIRVLRSREQLLFPD